MFPDLPAPVASEETLLSLGRSGAVIDDPDLDNASERDNHCIAAGWTIFGQFIAHDITADRSLLAHHADAELLRNARTPQLDLDAIYGDGPGGSKYFYDLTDPDKLLIGTNDAGQPNDVPRNEQGVALVGDPRNDVHALISQLHVAFLKFHNRVVDLLRDEGVPEDHLFDEAQRLVRWHYQWIVLHEFLPLTAGSEIVTDVLHSGPRFYRYQDEPFIPVEFADAAYRYGHSQIRAVYQLNEHASGRVFPECIGGCPVPQERVIDWRHFFALDDGHPPQPTRRIDARLVHPLIDLPNEVVGTPSVPEHRSLAVRDLLRGKALDLPSGEAVARVMNVEPLTPEELGWDGETSLWYYILKESELREQGERLGPVGGRIVAEVLVGLVQADPGSFWNGDRDWQPTLPSAAAGSFTMADLLRLAAVPGAV
jgi:hypothetical protein